MKGEKVLIALVLVSMLLIPLISAELDSDINQNYMEDNSQEIVDYEEFNQQEQVPEFEGYIVQFEDEPLAIKQKEIKEIAERNEEQIKSMSILNIMRYGLIFFGTREKDVERKFSDYKNGFNLNNEEIKNKIKVELRKDKINSLVQNKNSLNPNNLNVLGEYKNLFNGVALDITKEEAEKIKEIRGVKEVYPNYRVYLLLSDSIPLIGADSVWGLDNDGNNCSISGKECLTGNGITIAIIDDGINYTLEDLGGCFGPGCKVVGGFDFGENDADPMSRTNGLNHGTHCAGIAAATGEQDFGGWRGPVKGVAPSAKIYAYKVTDSAENIFWNFIEQSIDRASDPNNDGNFEDHVDIISLSLGGSAILPSVSIDNAMNLGIIMVISAGNSGPEGGEYCKHGGDGSSNSICFPGSIERVITVGATDKFDKIAGFSSRGPIGNIPKPDIVAPGVGISSTFEDYFPVVLSGTSMSTPHVAGAAALIKQAYPNMNHDEIKAVLMNSAIDIGEDINTQGAGRLNVLEALKSLKRQSKITNNKATPITGNIIMKLQKKVGESWVDGQIVTNQQVTIPANGFLKLDDLWNAKDIEVDNAGNYRVYAKFEASGKIIEDSWEFGVE